MFNGFVRFFIFVTTIFVAWLATGRLLSATHPAEWWWLGYVQATGVELVLGYCVWLIARTTEKGIVGLMILFFGVFSIAAQILHAHFFGVALPDENTMPVLLVYAWKYVLPAIPTLAGVSVGLLELAESSPLDLSGLKDRVGELFARHDESVSPVARKAYNATGSSVRPFDRKRKRKK